MQLTSPVSAGSFAGALRRSRETAALSQRALAKRSGLTPAYLSLLESGRRMPERAAVERIAAGLDLDDSGRGDLLLAAGYASATASPPPLAGPLADAEALLLQASFPPEQRALMTALIVGYAQGLAARARAGKPLVSDMAAPWQQRILEAMQEKMSEDFESFRDSYTRPIFDL